MLLCLLLTPGMAHAAPAADQSQQIQQILSKIVASDAARGDRIEITLADGVLTWKFEAHSCFQAIYRATLSELDLPKSALVSNPERRGDAWLKTPCRQGNCVSAEYGTHVWPAKPCNIPRNHSSDQRATFQPPSFPRPLGEELLQALRP
jgi:hypothetical protein